MPRLAHALFALLTGALVSACCGRHLARQDRTEAVASSSASAPASGAPAKPKKSSKKRKKSTRKGKNLAKPSKTAADKSKGEGDCGSVTVDGVEVPLECVLENPDPLRLEGTDVIPRSALDGDPTRAGGLLLPEVIDHREEGTEGPVRNQGKSSSCTAHAMASAIDHALMRHDGEPSSVSVLHLWSRYHRSRPGHADSGNLGRLLASEEQMPFDVKLACMWASNKTCKGCKIDGKVLPCNQPVDEAMVAAADAKPYARVLHAARVDAPTPLHMRQILARGQDVWMGMKIERAAFRAASEGDHVVGSFEPSARLSGHSMLIAGYKTQPDGTYFLLHNSWGTRWGEGGYAWIHERQLADVQAIRVVEAVRHGAEMPPGLAEPVALAPGCPEGKVPDAASMACVDACPDGSPPLAGACPGSDCEAGEVSIAGRCVASAPSRQGSASASGVQFSCAPGGCVYRVPGKKFGCAHDSCAFSCAAPAFVLEHSAGGVFCSE